MKSDSVDIVTLLPVWCGGEIFHTTCKQKLLSVSLGTSISKAMSVATCWAPF